MGDIRFNGEHKSRTTLTSPRNIFMRQKAIVLRLKIQRRRRGDGDRRAVSYVSSAKHIGVNDDLFDR